MKRLLCVVLTLLFAIFNVAAMQQTADSSASASKPATKRGPIFRASKEQIKQAQAMLKERNLYSGEQTGKLDGDTRTALKKYQEAEGLKVTGTLNKVTLEKMSITLTDRQKTM